MKKNVTPATEEGDIGGEREMKKIIISEMILVIMSVFLGGCFIAVEDYDRGGHGRDRDRGERHEEHHGERR